MHSFLNIAKVPAFLSLTYLKKVCMHYKIISLILKFIINFFLTLESFEIKKRLIVRTFRYKNIRWGNNLNIARRIAKTTLSLNRATEIQVTLLVKKNYVKYKQRIIILVILTLF